MGRNCRFLQGPDTDPAKVRELGEAVRSGAERRVTLLNYRNDGKPFWNELYLAPVHDGDGRLVQYVGVQNDVTERRRAEEQVAHMAYHDALTGLCQPGQAGGRPRSGRADREVGAVFFLVDDALDRREGR